MSRMARKLLLHGLLLLLLLAFSSGTAVATGPQSPDKAPARPVACVLVAGQHANQLLLSLSPVTPDLSSASAEMCKLTDNPAGYDASSGAPATVDLVSSTSDAGVTQEWWWVAWPWLMLLLALLSLSGYVLIRRQQEGAVQQPRVIDN